MENSIAKDESVVAVVKEIGQVPAVIKVIDVTTRTEADARVQYADARLKIIHKKPVGTKGRSLDEMKAQARAVWQDWNDLINELAAPWEKDKEFHVQQVKVFDREEKKKLEQAQRELEAKALKEAEEKQLAEAEVAAAAGDMKTAEAIIEEVPIPVTPVLKSDLPKLDARKYTTRWKARVQDTEKLIKFVASMLLKAEEYDAAGEKALAAAHRDWMNALTPNEAWLNQKARANEDKLNIPGVVAYEQ